jgi:alkylation response protein AidB-like acyl-CoA dehydrogenase
LLSLAANPGAELIAWQELLIEHGYAARTIPPEYGGYGAAPDLLKAVIIDEEFARAGVSRGIGGQGPDMLVPTLLEHGSEEQKRRWVSPTLRGEVIWCQGYSEPGAGSDLASLQTRAVLDGDDFILNGQKIWTSSAHFADMMFALVRTEPDAPRHAGISYLLVPMKTPGIEVRPLRTMTGGAEFNEVFFTDVRVPQSNVVGKRGDGWSVANTTLRHERNMLANTGRLETALVALVHLMQQETCNGGRAIDSPLLCDRLLRVQARVLAMKYHSLRLLTLSLKGESPGVAGFIVKLLGCQLAHDICALAVDVMGELGVLYHHSKYERARGLCG